MKGDKTLSVNLHTYTNCKRLTTCILDNFRFINRNRTVLKPLTNRTTTTFRNNTLRYKLQRDFKSLAFHKPRNPIKSALVSAKQAQLKDLAGDNAWVLQESSSDDDMAEDEWAPTPMRASPKADLFRAGLALRSTMDDHLQSDTPYHTAISRRKTVVVIRSPDTDVAILCLHHSRQIPASLAFDTGRQNSRRLLNISRMASLLTPELCASLLGLHAMTGTDTTSSFYGHSKAKCLRLVKDDPERVETVRSLGKSYNLAAGGLLPTLEKLVCRLYGSKHATCTELRYERFCSSEGNEKLLPPTRGALQQHSLRANYQAKIWADALQADVCAPSPHGHGWRVSDCVEIVWSEDPVPATILPLVSC